MHKPIHCRLRVRIRSASAETNDIFLGNTEVSTQGLTYTSYHTLPDSVTPGNYYVLVVEDYTHIITETNETNNVSFTPIKVTQPNVDLVIEQANLSPMQFAPGDYFYIDYSVANIGTTTAFHSYAGYYLSKDSIWDSSDSLLGNQAIPALSEGTDYVVDLGNEMVLNVDTGAYYFIFVADYSQIVSETNETNNSKAIPIHVIENTTQDSIDLWINNISQPATLIPGEILTVSFDFNNTGNVNPLNPLVAFYLSTDTIFDSGDRLVDSTQLFTILPGTPSFVNYTMQIPANMANDNYYLLYVADPFDMIAETNENNNVAWAGMNLNNKLVDIEATYFSLTQTWLNTGQTVSGTVQYDNLNTNATQIQSAYYLSTDSTLDGTDQKLKTILLSPVSGLNQATIQLTIPDNVLSGNYYIVAQLDSDSAIAEYNEANNDLAVAVTINTVTGISGATNTKSVLYPNPASDVVNVPSSDQAEVSFYNELGENVLNKQLNGTEALDVSGLNAGVYQVQIKSNGRLKIDKLLIVK